MIAIDLSRQQTLDANPNNFYRYSRWSETLFVIIEKAKEFISHFSQGYVRVLKSCFALI